MLTLNKEPEKPHQTGPLHSDGGAIHIRNASPYEVEYLFSGPEAVSVKIAACPSCQVTSAPLAYCPSAGPEVEVKLKAGTYDVVATSDRGEFVFPFTGRWTVEPGASYSGCYYLVSP